VGVAAEPESSIFKFNQTRESSDNLILIAFCRVAPSDLFKLRAIFAAGTFFRARDLSSRMSGEQSSKTCGGFEQDGTLPVP
jgi:hypothetical protein